MGKKQNNKRKEKKEEVEIVVSKVPPFPWSECSLPKTSKSAKSQIQPQRGPSGRMGCALIPTKLAGCGCDGYVVGGYNENGNNEEVWKFAIETKSWNRVKAKNGTSPYPRIMAKYCSMNTPKDGLSLFLFGGTNENGENENDLWQLPLYMEPPIRWKNIKMIPVTSSNDKAAAESPALLPPPRCNHAMTSLQDGDTNGGFIFIHGGESDKSPVPLDDLWVVDVRNDQSVSCIQANDKIVGKAPTSRCSHEATFLPSSRAVVFFGGVGVPTLMQESVSMLCGEDPVAAAAANAANADENAPEEFDGIMPLNDLFILHLGDSCNASFGSTDFFSNWRWSCVSMGENSIAPSPRSLPALAVTCSEINGETLHVFGGYGLYEEVSEEVSEAESEGMIQIGYLNDLWAFNLSMNKWVCSKDAVPVATAADSTTVIEQLDARNGHGLCVTNAGLVSFGGYSGKDFLNQLLVAPCDWADKLLSVEDEEGGGDEEDEVEEEDEEGEEDEDEVEEDEEEEQDSSEPAGLVEDTAALSLNQNSASMPDSDVEQCGEEEEDNEEDEKQDIEQKEMRVKIRMWEFSQNDPKKDSGSKLVKYGMAKTLKVNQSFGGIVLSSEATTVLSPADLEVVLEKGIGGVNCSWNRLDEVPSRRLGNAKYHRLLPRLLAANSVNYGKPFKMNTAEACGAALYIVGLKEDASQLLAPFAYGEEFLRLNKEALEAYSSAADSDEIRQFEAMFEQEREAAAAEKQKRQNREGSNYMADMDLPPSESEEEYEDEEEIVAEE